MRLALMFFAAVILAQSQPPPPSLGKEAKSEQKNSATQKQQVQPNNNQPQPSPITVNQYATQPQSGDKPQANAEQDKSPSNETIIAIGTVLLFFATMFLALATAVLCVVAILQWRTLEAHKEAFEELAGAATMSANTAREALENTERADILPGTAQIPLPIDQDSQLGITFNNFGRTRAKNAVFKMTVATSEERLPEQVMGPVLVGPMDHKTIRTSPLGNAFSPETIAGIVNGTIVLEFIASVTYEDIFGKGHETSSGGELIPASGAFKITTMQAS